MRHADFVRFASFETRAIVLLLSASLLAGGCTVNGSGLEEAAGRRAGIGLTATNFELLDPSMLDLSGIDTRTGAAAALERRFSPPSDGDGEFEERTDLVIDAAGGSTAVYTASGLADDAIQAEQVVAEFDTAPDGSLVVTALGRRWRCWRSAVDGDGWTNRPCP